MLNKFYFEVWLNSRTSFYLNISSNISMKKIILGVLPLAMLAACGGPSKKVLIISKGDIAVQGNDVTVKEGSSYAEQEVELSGSGKTTLNITSPAGKTTADIEGPGYFVLNLRKDTLIGAYQPEGDGSGSIPEEVVRKRIDSLSQLIKGANVSAANRNFLLAPGQSAKISANTASKVYGPFHKVPAQLEATPDGKAPEIYKFLTVDEARETLGKLTEVVK